MIQPTWDNVRIVIEDGADDLHGIADALGQHAGDLTETLAEMVDKGLLNRRYDDGVTRYRVPSKRSTA